MIFSVVFPTPMRLTDDRQRHRIYQSDSDEVLLLLLLSIRNDADSVVYIRRPTSEASLDVRSSTGACDVVQLMDDAQLYSCGVLHLLTIYDVRPTCNMKPN